MCVSVFCKFKYAWCKLVGTLYKFLMLFEMFVMFFFQLKNIFEIKMHIKFMPGRLDCDDCRNQFGYCHALYHH